MRRLAEFAKQYAERAAQRNPGNEEASVALSDALRLSGNLVAARAELDRARATEGVAKAETLRVASLLAVDEAGGDFHAGRALAEQAVAREPTLLRARLLLARCLMADDDFEGARMHLDAAASFAGAAHPVIAEVRAEIALAEAQARKAKESAGGKPDARRRRGAGPKAATASLAAERNGDASGQGHGQGHGDRQARGTVEESGDPAELVKRGEAALEQGAVPAAARLFERALVLDPGMPRARTGLGYVALERGQPRQAVNHFRPAARAGNPEALIGLGDAYRRLNRVRDALAAYRQYLKQYPRGEQQLDCSTPSRAAQRTARSPSSEACRPERERTWTRGPRAGYVNEAVPARKGTRMQPGEIDGGAARAGTYALGGARSCSVLPLGACCACRRSDGPQGPRSCARCSSRRAAPGVAGARRCSSAARSRTSRCSSASRSSRARPR